MVDQTGWCHGQVRFLMGAVSPITAKHSSSDHLPTPGRRLPCCTLVGATERIRCKFVTVFGARFIDVEIYVSVKIAIQYHS